MDKNARKANSTEARAKKVTHALLLFMSHMSAKGELDLAAIRAALRPVPNKRTRKRIRRTAYEPENLLTPDQAARVLKLSPKTLANKRSQGDGPRFIRLSTRAIRYRYQDLLEYVDSGSRMSTSESTGPERVSPKNKSTKPRSAPTSSRHSLSVISSDPGKTRSKKRRLRNSRHITDIK